MNRSVRCVLVFAVCFLCLSTSAAEPTVGPIPAQIRSEFKLADFYTKGIIADGFPIVASAKVNDFALKEAAYLVNHMLTGRNDLRQALIRNKVRFSVMGCDQWTCDVPEHSDLTPASYWNRRARGLGATTSRPSVSCGEENLLGFPGDPYQGESILIHEFGHAIQEMGVNYVDKTFELRLKKMYDAALHKGLWKDTYAATNPHEYWAEGVQIWFHCNWTNRQDHNHIGTRKELQEYDLGLSALLREVFGDREWVYEAPAKRKQPAHLAGYDLKSAKMFEWPAELKTPVPRDLPRSPGK